VQAQSLCVLELMAVVGVLHRERVSRRYRARRPSLSASSTAMRVAG